MNRKAEHVKVQWIEFENLKTGLAIERIYFNKDITLLVGLSGVGKTQILDMVEYTLNLAVRNDIFLRPYRVGIGILIDGDEYEWYYEMSEMAKDDFIINEENHYAITYEKLQCNGEKIFERTNEQVDIIGYDKVPQPKKEESLILQYSEDENFATLISGIRKLYSVEFELDIRGGIKSESFSRLKSKVADTMKNDKTVDFQTFSHLPSALKLYVAKRYYPDLYLKIFEAIKKLFTEIEDLDVEEDCRREMYLVSIQVYGKKLLQHDISNGMLKTIYYIVELFTMSEESLVLIDEFENGLGVNCIDLLSELMLFERRDLQFIITSHHPKIINFIDKDKWRIIEREKCMVKNSSSKDYGIGNSQHDAYFNLLNRWEFEGKI